MQIFLGAANLKYFVFGGGWLKEGWMKGNEESGKLREKLDGLRGWMRMLCDFFVQFVTIGTEFYLGLNSNYIKVV